jgi:uncharacterized repeat protein (TIGR03803 family)
VYDGSLNTFIGSAVFFERPNMKYLASVLALAIALSAGRANSQTFSMLVQFTDTGGTATGYRPYGSLTVGGTNLFGMTFGGGAQGDGNIFSVGNDGTNYQNLVSFTGTSGTAAGMNPYGSLTLVGTTLYGMTSGGGANGDGNIFSLGMDGTNYQNLVSFTGTGGTAIGMNPVGGALTIIGTTIYGTTYYGGASGNGNIFSVGTDGTNYQSLVSFTGTSGTAIGQFAVGELTLSGKALYGTTQQGGASGNGNIFSVGTDGTNYQNLVSFTGTGGTAYGRTPQGSLAISGTTLYGMTSDVGPKFAGNVFSVGTDGTSYQNLVTFTGIGVSGSASGYEPFGSLIISGTSLYGMTFEGGSGGGNIFSVGVDGSDFQDLYNFTGGSTGVCPYGDLTLSDGTLFGMTTQGVKNDYGTVFALALPETPTPEPGALALVGAALATVAAYRWRRIRPRAW